MAAVAKIIIIIIATSVLSCILAVLIEQERSHRSSKSLHNVSRGENYAWWHRRHWFDLNEKRLPLNYSDIPEPGIPKPRRDDLIVEETIRPAV